MIRCTGSDPVGPTWLGGTKMAMMITLDDDLVAELENRAKKQQLSVEQFAIAILTEAMEQSESITPREAVTRIQTTAPNPSLVRPATANLADVLGAESGDPCFDLESWKQQWSVVEAELKALARANNVAEGRGR
jgi:plasmid stability protein